MKRLVILSAVGVLSLATVGGVMLKNGNEEPQMVQSSIKFEGEVKESPVAEAVVEKQVDTIESIDNQVEAVVEQPVYDVPIEDNNSNTKVSFFDSIAGIISEYLSSNNLDNRYHSITKYQHTIINVYANSPDMFLQNNYIENTNKCLIQLTDFIEANPNSRTHMFTCR